MHNKQLLHFLANARKVYNKDIVWYRPDDQHIWLSDHNAAFKVPFAQFATVATAWMGEAYDADDYPVGGANNSRLQELTVLPPERNDEGECTLWFLGHSPVEHDKQHDAYRLRASGAPAAPDGKEPERWVRAVYLAMAAQYGSFLTRKLNINDVVWGDEVRLIVYVRSYNDLGALLMPMRINATPRA